MNSEKDIPRSVTPHRCDVNCLKIPEICCKITWHSPSFCTFGLNLLFWLNQLIWTLNEIHLEMAETVSLSTYSDTGNIYQGTTFLFIEDICLWRETCVDISLSGRYGGHSKREKFLKFHLNCYHVHVAIHTVSFHVIAVLAYCSEKY